MGIGDFNWTTTSTTLLGLSEAEEEWEFSPEDFVESGEPRSYKGCNWHAQWSPLNHQAWPEGDVLSAKDANEIFSRLSMLEDSVYQVS